jgi:hypothetical protein
MQYLEVTKCGRTATVGVGVGVVVVVVVVVVVKLTNPPR